MKFLRLIQETPGNLRLSAITGAVAGALWITPIVISGRFELGSDIIFIFFISMLMTSMLYLFVCAPISIFTHKRINTAAFCMLGAFVGFMSSLAFAVVFTRSLPHIGDYILRFPKEFSIFTLAGLVYFLWYALKNRV